MKAFQGTIAEETRQIEKRLCHKHFINSGFQTVDVKKTVGSVNNGLLRNHKVKNRLNRVGFLSGYLLQVENNTS